MISGNDANRSLDRVLRKFLKDIPLSVIYSAIRTGKIKINGKNRTPDYITQKGDKLEIKPKLFRKIEIKENVSQTIRRKPCILLRTGDLLFINKKIGETVHGKDSLLNAVLTYFPGTGKSLSFTPGPLHRLDKNTSGIITFSQSLKGAQRFSDALQSGKIEKYYLGIIEGLSIQKEMTDNVGGKKCITIAEPLTAFKAENLCLVRFRLITGRKHQIRLQCGKRGTPLLNDKKYGSTQSAAGIKNYFLHAYKLKFTEPIFDDIPQTITAPLPKSFKKFLKRFGIRKDTLKNDRSFF